MNIYIRVTSIFWLLAISLIADSAPITDTYNTGDNLTAALLNNIKNAVNDNDGRIETLEIDGIPGPQGPIGLTGPQGPQGEVGPQGPAGLDAPDRSADIDQNTANIANNASRITDAELDITANRSDIDSNTAAIAGIKGGIRVLSNGITIGAYIGSYNIFSDSALILYANTVIVLSGNGYIFAVDTSGGISTRLSTTVNYESGDCTGQGYIDAAASNSFSSSWSRNQGWVIRGGITNTIYYLPKGSNNAVTITPQSRLDNSGCNPESGTRDAYPVEINDPDITSVSDNPVGPITLGY